MQRLSSDRVKQETTPARGRRALLLWTLLGGIVWCGILPAISRQPHIRAEIEHEDSLGIDPSALFYTDLDLMDDVLTRIDRFQQDNPRALWIPDAKP